MPSTSAGLFATAFGLPGGSVVVPAAEFPANRYPWIRAAEAGRIDVRLLESDDGRYTPEMFAAAVDSTTTAVAVSQVDYRSGFRMDIEGIREAIGDALLIVDSVQSLGALQSPFPHADVVAAGGQKWLRSGIGIAVMGVSDRAMERLQLTLSGWLGVEEPFDTEMPTPHPALRTAERFTQGFSPLTAMAGLRGALESLHLAGIADVEATVIERADTARDELRAAGCELLFTPEDQSERSGIVSFRRRDEASAVTNERLTDAGFTITERNGWLRVAPHATTHPDAPAAMAEVVRS
jgi:selenocysteine lyase/cysteine desulfurase